MSNSSRSSFLTCLIAGISWLTFVGGCSSEASRVPTQNGDDNSGSSNPIDQTGSQPPSATPTGKGSLAPTAKGRQLLTKGKYKAALAEMKTWLDKHPEDVDGRLVKTLALLALNRIPDADVLSSDLLREHQGDGRVVVVRASVLKMQKKVLAAQQLCDRSLETNPDNKYLHAFLAQLHAESGDQLLAENHFSRLRELDPEYDGIPVGEGFEEFMELIGRYKTEVAAVLAAVMSIGVKMLIDMASSGIPM